MEKKFSSLQPLDDEFPLSQKPLEPSRASPYVILLASLVDPISIRHRKEWLDHENRCLEAKNKSLVEEYKTR